MRWAVRSWAGVWPVVRQSGERRHTGRVWRSRVQHVWYSTSQIPGTIWCRSTCSRCKCGGQGNICRIGGVGVTVRGGTEVTGGEPRGVFPQDYWACASQRHAPVPHEAEQFEVLRTWFNKWVCGLLLGYT